MPADDALTTQWMFQYNPDWYDLEALVQRRLIEHWKMFRNRDHVRVGQRIYFMRSGGRAGGETAAITAIGRIASLIYEKPEETEQHVRYWAGLVYDERVIPPLTRPEMQDDTALRDYKPYALGVNQSAFRRQIECCWHIDQRRKTGVWHSGLALRQTRLKQTRIGTKPVAFAPASYAV